MLAQTVLVTIWGEGGRLTVDGAREAAKPAGTMLVVRVIVPV